jgi:response regulator RpfG family c-di-GMP phosphodiesterase
MLDVKMPKIDGFELYNKIKKIDNRTKVCFITATEKNNYTLERVRTAIWRLRGETTTIL